MYRGILIACILLIILNSCTQKVTDPQVLIDADLAFSAMSEDVGASAAFTEYADPEVVLFRNGTVPIQGHSALVEYYTTISDDNAILTWKPENAEIAVSGDLGYTWGNYYLNVTDSLGNVSNLTGNYVSIWKKQPNGDWKFVLDGGTVPQPTTAQE